MQNTSSVLGSRHRLDLAVPLVVLPSPYRELTRPLLRYIDRVEQTADQDIGYCFSAEVRAKRWWHHLLHNQSSLLLKATLLFKEGVIVTNVPYHVKS